jgi:(S)-ureidoglycine aminohydrolase
MSNASPELFGHTRARVAARHALITPANHVGSAVPGIAGATAVVLINGAMGAKMAQLLVTFQRGGGAELPADDRETFGYVVRGAASVAIGGGRRARCGAGGYFFAPAGQAWSLTAPAAGTQLVLFQKRYVPLAGVDAPAAVIGDAAKVKGQPFLGDPAANLQVLLPDEPAYDLAVNVFAYQPGGHLPFVEVHIMEHGLLMLSGQGVYRLEESWYPVQAGDAIWMAPYCAQWFVAMGKAPASYLYYKDVNRAPL